MNRTILWSATAILGLATLLSSCGLTVDSQPRDLAQNERIDLALSVNPGAVVTTGSELVYFLSAEGTNQRRFLRAVKGNFGTTPAERISTLLAGPTLQQVNGQLQTALPVGTQLHSALVRRDGVLVVDITDQILTLSGTALTEAVAQIVYTSAELNNVTGVLLRVDGDDRQWPSGEGSQVRRVLTTYDYPGLLESSQPDFPALPPELLG